jgi:protein gp37
MGKRTNIGWTDHTLNFWVGCHKVSEECRHCYIDAIMRRAGREPFRGPMKTKGAWKEAYAFNRAALRDRTRRRVFTCSISDFFHPGADAWRPEAWQVIQACQGLDWLVLTKRPELIADRLPPDWGDGYANVWLGVTIGMASSMHRLPLLKSIPAKIRFISAEPLLGPLNFRGQLEGIQWIITGCEQAAKNQRRVMEMAWVRDIDEQCREAGVAHFFKQHYLGERGRPVHDGVLDGVQRQTWPR